MTQNADTIAQDSLSVSSKPITESIRVISVDDHPIVRRGIKSILEPVETITIVGEAGDGFEARTVCAEKVPDVVLLDISMPGPKLTDLIKGIKDDCTGVKILILSAHDDDVYIREVIKVGVDGYLLKEEAPDVVAQAIQTVHNGSTWFSQSIIEKLVQWQFSFKEKSKELKFTDREKDIISLVAIGLDNLAISKKLGLAEQTIRNYVSTIYEKIDVRTRAEAVVWAIESGYSNK